MKTIIRNAHIVNEGCMQIADLLMVCDRIEKIAPFISLPQPQKYMEINAEGKCLFPGVIDSHVHFREPGLTHKGDLSSESKAAVAGGVTSFMDMPNTYPNTLTQNLLEEKYSLAQQKSLANYSFFMGVNKTNLEEALKTDPETVCGITDDGLYFNDQEGILASHPEFLEHLFNRTQTLVALHSENDGIIRANYLKYYEQYGEDIPVNLHPLIRSEEACLSATQNLINLAKRHQNRLHILHISTQAEAELFDALHPPREKRITGEVCGHHLWFSDKDYDHLGNKIKWNPAIKNENDKNGLLTALLESRIDSVASDHAPHAAKEKTGSYKKALPGGPMVQHTLYLMLELYHKGLLTLEKIAEKMSHNVADIYRIRERGYIREGYHADLVLIDLYRPWQVTPNNLFYKCGWSPLSGERFTSTIMQTFVNGNLVFDRGKIANSAKRKRLLFEKIG